MLYDQKKLDKFSLILDNYINGNLSDFGKSVRGMTKLEMLYFVDFADAQGTKNITDAILGALSRLY